ncbi:diphthine methyl ester synthase [Chironomus tepperi]|uniref:diphthine methyl ester synthase n=1 Tax=Chironomus tepperi TaxID=113505 RepID=UPI00391FB03D
MLYVIGLGLGDAKDITVKGLEILKRCELVYLESYTSILTCGKEEMEKFYEKEIIVADRDFVEQEADIMLNNAETKEVAFLVVGDPFSATTHTDLILRAKERGIKFQIIHNASIMNAVGSCGLQLYHFGETISIPFWTDSWKPESFYEKIKANRLHGLHTLCLLDIKVKEPTFESMTKKKKEYMPPKFMTVSEAADQLLQIVEKKKSEGIQDLAYDENSIFVGVARIGHESQKIIVCSLAEMKIFDLGPPLHSLVLPSNNLHELERDYLQQFSEKPL